MSNPQATEPRNGQVVLGGIPWLARMIDKAKLEAAGAIDVYDLDYPCPMDQGLLAKLNLDAKTFQQIAVNAQNDEEIIVELKNRGIQVE